MYDLQQALAREIDRDRLRAAAAWRLAREVPAPGSAHGIFHRVRHHVVERARFLSAPRYSSRGEASDCV